MEIWKKFIPTLTHDFEGFKTFKSTLMHDLEAFKTSMEEVATHVMEIAREGKLQVGPEALSERLQSFVKTLTDEEFFLWVGEESGFLRWNLLLVKML